MNHRIFPVFLCALTVCTLFSGCGGDTPKSGAGHSFSYTLVGNPDTLDPQLAVSSSAKTVLANLFEGLFALDADGTVKNGVVKDYTVSEDGLHYVFDLRTDSYWYQATDTAGDFGKEAAKAVTAADFEFAFQRLFDPLYESPYREQFRCIEHAEDILAGREDPSMIGVYARRSDRLEIVLDTPAADLPMLLAETAALPCNAEYFEQTRGRYGLDEASVIGNGSFSVQRWLYDPYGKYNVIQMVRNPLNHEVSKIYPTDLQFFIEQSQADAERIFTAGTADCLVTTQTTILNDSTMQAQGAFSLTLGLTANPDSDYGRTPYLLQALAKSLDYAAVQSACGPDLQAGSGILPPAVRLSNKGIRELLSDAVYRKYDMTAAKAAYAQALSALSVQEPEEGTVLAPAGLMDYAALLRVTAQWESALGLHMRVDEVPQSEYEQRLRSGSYTLALVAVTGEDSSPASLLAGFAQTPGIHCEAADQVRALLQEASAAAGMTEQVACLRRAEEAILADACFLPLFYKQRALVCKPGVEDVRCNLFTGTVQFSEAKYFD